MTAAGAALGGERGRLRLRLHHPALLALVVIGGVAAASTGFLTIAPNRLVSGLPVMLLEVAGGGFATAIVAAGIALSVGSFLAPSRAAFRLASAVAGVALLLVLATAGQGAEALAAAAPRLARVSLGPAFWILLAAFGLALIDAMQRARAGAGECLAAAFLVCAVAAAMAHFGLFEALSLAREFHTRQAQFGAALGRHVELVAGAVGAALAIGFPLGVALVRRPAWQGSAFAALNLLQTIPSIALFGLLLAPLSALATAVPLLAALGIGGVGVAPAIIALVLYSLLPVVRNTVAGIGGVDAGVLDAARGIGLSRRQRFWQVELPLAAPLLLAGLRIVLVQAIGLAVIAALIGAGGLGTFVFEGLGQYAADLVLLGALPAIFLALAANFLMQLAVSAVAR